MQSPEQGGLSETEQMLVRTRRQADSLAVALVRNPFDPSTVAELRRFLEHDAGPAQAAYEALRALAPEVLRARLEHLARLSRKGTCPDLNGRVTS
ncbi:hypothetical protein [Actinacidiphila rubida]|uniref:Uncharacterized protein n=1 Tax=Actinacidiphila rubida TaxID=310780 RepID=A0A1H8TGJ6_9ACTN|nr:hypothetical protein [Actinacidiphila rubida]SEO89643.1 hypothetical protein SAMN05216267_105230 [Actinacidiphila rubida]